jgi:hypothetical protein
MATRIAVGKCDMKLFKIIVLGLLLTACATSGSQNNPTNPGGNDSGPYTGTVIAEGTGNAHTLDLNNFDPAKSDQWVSRDTISVYEAAAVVLSTNEIMIAEDSFGSFMTVQVKDLDTFGLKESFEWSDDETVGRVNSLGASRDGKYLAALVEGLGRPYLEVLEREGRRVVYSGLDIVANDTLTWTPGNELVLALNLSSEGNPERWGAIGVIPLERFLNATSANIQIDLYAIFTRAEWELGVYSPALSPDGSQLVYTYGTDLWVTDFEVGATAHQLTTGPIPKGGAQFSPDSASIVFVAGNRDFQTETYIIPNHRNEPLFIDVGQGAGNEYLIGQGTLVDTILAWRP